jgi:hypothetical protein
MSRYQSIGKEREEWEEEAKITRRNSSAAL